MKWAAMTGIMCAFIWFVGSALVLKRPGLLGDALIAIVGGTLITMASYAGRKRKIK